MQPVHSAAEHACAEITFFRGQTVRSKIGIFLLGLVVMSGTAQNQADVRDKYRKDLENDPASSITHFRAGEIDFQRGDFLSAANEFREALVGDLRPGWIEAWSHLNLGKIFDATGQRERAMNEYRQVQRVNDNTRGALDEANLYLEFPYPRR